MGESYEEQLSRVKLMASGDSQWDLSDNDIAALKSVLLRLSDSSSDASFFEDRMVIHGNDDRRKLGAKDAEIADLKRQLEEAKNRNHKWNTVMSQVLAGSEYHDNPAAYVERFREQGRLVIEQQKEFAAKRAENADLKTQLFYAKDAHDSSQIELDDLKRQLEETHASRDALIKDRGALLDQTQKGPLSANEWQIRAIRAERQLAEARKDTERLKSAIQLVLDSTAVLNHLPSEHQQELCEAIDAAREDK